jgi:PAS domain S-box-containing protein
MYQVLNCLTTEHDWRLVVLGGAICLLASAAAMSLFHRAKASSGRSRLIWIGMDAAVSGCGIWATHFIAMLAYDPGTGAAYNIATTLLSLVFAIAITAVGLAIALSDLHRWAVAIGGAVIGGGVAAMHYTGMMALEIPALIVWSPGIVVASVLFGCVFAALALFVADRSENLGHAVAATVLLTVAIVSHHFTAMGAVTLIPDPTLVGDGVSIPPPVLSFLTAAAAVIIIAMSLLASVIERRSKSELHRQKVVLDTALENMSQGLCMFDAEGRILLFNERYGEMMGRTGLPLTGRLLIDVLQDQKSLGQWDGDPAAFSAGLVAEARAGNTATRTVVKNGRTIRIVDQPMKGGGWVATFEDITEWQQAQQRISHMARHDALTNLPNRTLFREQLEQALRLAKRATSWRCSASISIISRKSTTRWGTRLATGC